MQEQAPEKPGQQKLGSSAPPEDGDNIASPQGPLPQPVPSTRGAARFANRSGPMSNQAGADFNQRGSVPMNDLEKGITRASEGYRGKSWNILGQTYYPKASCDSSFAFETNSGPGQFVPVHIHPHQDEFILMLEGVLDLKLDGAWTQAKAGDLVRMPRGIPHGYFNKSDTPARALFWVSPAGRLEALFEALNNLEDIPQVIRLSAEHAVDFLPPEANG
jgi:mannose-6-phosphate isomerase-like protein (cupin superfamily)